MSGKCTEETTNQTSIDGRTIDEFHRSISRLKLVGWLLVPEAILRQCLDHMAGHLTNQKATQYLRPRSRFQGRCSG